jgi:transcriptional regulator with XRE-family HTH domain
MENEIIKISSQIGNSIRLYREKSNANQKEIAQKSSISVSMLSQIERGVTSPSIETLGRICFALNISLSQIFGAIEHKSSVSISKSGNRAIQDNNGAIYEQLAHFHSANGSAEMSLVSLEVGAKISFPATGEIIGGAQMGYILSGSAKLEVDGVEYEIHSGNGVSFPANLAHSLINNTQRSFSLARKFVALWAASPSRVNSIEI